MNHSAVLLQTEFFSSLKKASMSSNTVMKGQNNRHRIKDAVAHRGKLQKLAERFRLGFLAFQWSGHY